MRKSESISDVFKPDEKLAKTSMDGRVIYENIDYAWLSGDAMRLAGEKMAKAFPEYEIWVTGGPYRFYDVKYQVDAKAKIISLDFYSVRPGLHYTNEIVEEIKEKLPELEVKALKA